MLHECFYENMLFVVLSLPDSSTGSVRFFFFGIFPYFLLLVFSFTPFHATALPFPKLPGFYETDIFESNRNIFRLSSAHDIHSVLRFAVVQSQTAVIWMSGFHLMMGVFA